MQHNEFQKVFESETIGVWAIKSRSASRPSLLLKLPSTTIKSINKGCRVDFFVGITIKEPYYLAIAVEIYDTEVPLLVSIIARTEAEFDGCRALLQAKDFSAVIYDQFGAVNMNGSGYLELKARMNNPDLIHRSFSHPTDIYQVDEYIYSLAQKINSGYGNDLPELFDIYRFSMHLTVKANLVLMSAPSGSFAHDADSDDEGKVQEQQLHQELYLHYGKSVFLSPQVTVGKKSRELIDVLLSQPEYTFFFESKALSINTSETHHFHDKRASKIVRHCLKALGQIEGAIKSFRNTGLPIVDTNGQVINRHTASTFIGVIVISEFMYSDEWESVWQRLMITSESLNIPILVVDMSELVNILKISVYKQVHIGEVALQRFEASREHKTLWIRSIDSSVPILPQAT